MTDASKSERIKPWQFKPGQSGNPSGRAKGSVSLSSLLKARLRERPDEAAALMHRLIQDALDGDGQAMRVLLDRVDGSVALVVNGMSDAEMTERLGEVFAWLKDHLPPEFHQLISQGAYEVLLANDKLDNKVGGLT